MLIPAAQAHEKWFVPLDTPHARPEFYSQFNAWTVGGFIIVIVLLAVGLYFDRKFERSELYSRIERRVVPLRDYAAGVLAVATGLTLLWSAVHGVLLADNFIVATGTLWGEPLLMLEAVVGLLLVIGLYTPLAALALLVLFGAAVGSHGVVEAMDYLHYVGIAVFLLAFARGKWSLDWLLGKDFISRPKERRISYLALRVISGLTFLILAAGKWLRPELHFALLARYPDFNPYTIAHAIGFGFSQQQYVFILFVIELLVGIAVLAGIFTRIAAVALLPIMTGSVLFLGFGEMFGHLPIVGILFVLFVFGDRYHKEKGNFDLSLPEPPRH